jgi:HSP20 family molecular chaperone IbpA
VPSDVTADAISADYDAGVLTVRVAGAYASVAPTKIKVTSRGSKAELEG